MIRNLAILSNCFTILFCSFFVLGFYIINIYTIYHYFHCILMSLLISQIIMLCLANELMIILYVAIHIFCCWNHRFAIHPLILQSIKGILCLVFFRNHWNLYFRVKIDRMLIDIIFLVLRSLVEIKVS